MKPRAETPEDKAMTWYDAREVGEALFEQFDTLNPLTVRFTDLHKHVLNLEGFTGKPNESDSMSYTPALPGAGAHPKSLKPLDHSTPGVQSPWMMLATLPFPDETFDKAIAINSMQVWPDAVSGLREVRRVLKPGGIVVLGFTVHSGQARDGATESLAAAGFTDARIVERKALFCALASRGARSDTYDP